MESQNPGRLRANPFIWQLTMRNPIPPLLLTALLAPGCLAPSPEIRPRPGDFAIVEVQLKG